MRYLIFISLQLVFIGVFAQQNTEIAGIPKYDTTNISIEIRSFNYFYFCSKVYKIPRICEGQDQSNCCSYSTRLSKGEASPKSGIFSCNNGTSLSWYYFNNENDAELNLNNIANQYEKQNKKLYKTKISCLLVNTKVNALKMKIEQMDGNIGYRIMACGTINGQSVVVELWSQKELKSNDDIKSFEDIFKFN